MSMFISAGVALAHSWVGKSKSLVGKTAGVSDAWVGNAGGSLPPLPPPLQAVSNSAPRVGRIEIHDLSFILGSCGRGCALKENKTHREVGRSVRAASSHLAVRQLRQMRERSPALPERQRRQKAITSLRRAPQLRSITPSPAACRPGIHEHLHELGGEVVTIDERRWEGAW
jgi:hypothetical protein